MFNKYSRNTIERNTFHLIKNDKPQNNSNNYRDFNKYMYKYRINIIVGLVDKANRINL